MRDSDDIKTVYVGAVDSYAFRIDRMPSYGMGVSGQRLGGHLCGYVKLPAGHSLEYKREDQLRDEGIPSITYAEDESDGYWIGYDYVNSPNILEGTIVLDLKGLIDILKCH
jgi:hypothetical protein